MFRNKYKIEKKSALELKREDAAAKAAELRASFAASAQEAAGSAKKNAKQTRKDIAKANKRAGKKADKLVARTQKKADKATAKAPATLAGVAAGAGAAAATAAHAVQVKAQPLVDVASEKTAPVVEKAHDTLMDEIMPRVSEALAGVLASAAAAKEVAADKAQPLVDTANERVTERFGDVQGRSSDAYAVLKGDKVAVDSRKQKSGTALMVLGLLVAGAAAALTAWQQMQPKDDPWSTPLLDPYTPPTTGRDSSVAGTTAAGTATFGNDTTGTNADLSAAESAQGGDVNTVLSPVKDQEYTSEPSSATLNQDDGAGELLNPTQSFERDANGHVIGDEQKKTF